MSMPKARKRRWVEALLSGDYPQTKGTFKDAEGRYCATGVLFQVEDPRLLKRQLNGRGYFLDGDVVEKKFPKTYRRLNLTYAASARASLFGLPVKQFREIVQMNDSGASFKRIANWIEENVRSR